MPCKMSEGEQQADKILARLDECWLLQGVFFNYYSYLLKKKMKHSTAKKNSAKFQHIYYYLLYVYCNLNIIKGC